MNLRFLLALIPILFLLASCNEQINKEPVATNGELILTEADFMNNDTIPLTGEWLFFWQEFLNEKEMEQRNLMSTSTISVPSSWEDAVATPYGYGTYYLKILIPEEKVGNTLAISTTNQSTSYTLLVDGVRIASNGYVGSSKETSEPGFENYIVYFTPRDEEIHLVLHVSNFSHPSGGANQGIYLGTAEKVYESYTNTLAYTMFFIGAILVMGVYEICIFFYRKKDREFLYFGLLGITFSAYSLLRPPYYFNIIFPPIPWIWQERLEIITMFILCILYLLFIQKIFPVEMKKLLVNAGVILSTLYIAITALTKPTFYQVLLNYTLFGMGFFMLYIIYVLILAWYNKRSSAPVHLIANILFFVSVINDVLLSFDLISTIPLSTFGFFLFVLIHALNLSKDYVRKLEYSEKLTMELSELNRSLDEKIKDRTEELKRKNAELKYLTEIDGLTGVYNRRYFDEHANLEFQKALSSGQPLSILMLDLDNFKKYNDTYGHVVGDKLLINFSKILKDACENIGFTARYGGEEFAIVLPKMSLHDAVQFAENIRLLIEKNNHLDEYNSTHATASIGVSSTEKHEFKKFEELISCADRALYGSKANGKNQVTFL